VMGSFRLRVDSSSVRRHHHQRPRLAIDPKREGRFPRPGEEQRNKASRMPLTSETNIQRLTLRCCSKPQPPTKVGEVFFFVAGYIRLGQTCCTRADGE
jgi:hypothetical protein